MTASEARERVERIKQMGDIYGDNDPEGAHREEDNLHRDVLQYLAEVAPAELGELARISLTTLEFDFPRWYA